jgi:hypothetical protein
MAQILLDCALEYLSHIHLCDAVVSAEARWFYIIYSEQTIAEASAVVWKHQMIKNGEFKNLTVYLEYLDLPWFIRGEYGSNTPLLCFGVFKPYSPLQGGSFSATSQISINFYI